MSALTDILLAPDVRPFAVAAAIMLALGGIELLTTLVGFYLGYRGPMNYLLMFHAVMGTALVAAGAAALNQFLEREFLKPVRSRLEPPPRNRRKKQPHHHWTRPPRLKKAGWGCIRI